MNPFEVFKTIGNMKERLKNWEQRLIHIECEGVSGGGLVKVVISGDMKAKKVNIAPELFSDEEKRLLLEPLLISAFNDAIKNVRNKTREEMSSEIGFPLPEGIFDN